MTKLEFKEKSKVGISVDLSKFIHKGYGDFFTWQYDANDTRSYGRVLKKIFSQKPPRDGGNLRNKIEIANALPQPMTKEGITELMNSCGTVVKMGYTNSSVRKKANCNEEFLSGVTGGMDGAGLGIVHLLLDERKKESAFVALSFEQFALLRFVCFHVCLFVCLFSCLFSVLFHWQIVQQKHICNSFFKHLLNIIVKWLVLEEMW